MREEFFSKFKNYNNELEKILEKKDFSKDSKNLLLSMFYKLENSYNDYETVKRIVVNKQEFLENILENIRVCNNIELIKSNTEEFNEFKEKDIIYQVDLKIKHIKVIDNEIALLAAIFELNDFKIYLGEQYNLIRNSFPNLLNLAIEMNNTEILRDFNAFSWNTNSKEIKDICTNLIYQNIKIALSKKVIFILENTNNEVIEVINLIKEDLIKNYEQEIVMNFLNLVFKCSIIICIEKNKNERKRLIDEKNVLEEELLKIKDKKKYIEDIINKKKEFGKKLKEIDLILKDKNLLIKEYEKRNNQLSTYQKIFNLSHLTEKLQRERKKIVKNIEECNLKLEPNNYLKDKVHLEQQYDLIRFVDEEDKYKKILYKYVDDMQFLFLKYFLPKKIEISNTEEDIKELVYLIRYYLLVPYNIDKEINQIEEFKELINNILNKLIKKMYKLKILNTISTNEMQDIEIIKNIFYLRTISLDDIYIEIISIDKNNNYLLKIYDDKETLEKSIELKLNFNKKDKVKLKRKVKLFNGGIKL